VNKLVLLLCLFFCVSAQAALVENFNQSGSDLSVTHFSGYGSTSTGPRSALTSDMLVPEVAGGHIEVGGDKELVYTGSEYTITGKHLMTPDTSVYGYTDVTMEAFAAFSSTTGFGSRSAGLISRATGTTHNALDGYLLNISTGSNSIASMSLLKMYGGGGKAGDVLGQETFTFDYEADQLFMRLSTFGTDISASVWKMSASGTEMMATIAVQDDAFSEGRNGLYMFAREGSRVFIDDVMITAVPVPAAVWLFGSALAGLGWMRRKTTV
jgi:hypothetical protein